MFSQLQEDEMGKEYYHKILFNKKKNLNARMTKKGLLIDVLIYSSENPRAVEEEMQQYDIQFKLQIGIHYKYMKLLSEDLNEGQKSWFAAIDEVVFNCIKCIILSEKLRMIANQMT